MTARQVVLLLQWKRSVVARARAECERAQVLIEVARVARDRTAALLVRCAWCGAVKLGDGRFVPQRADERALPQDRISHGVCDRCLRVLLRRKARCWC